MSVDETIAELRDENARLRTCLYLCNGHFLMIARMSRMRSIRAFTKNGVTTQTTKWEAVLEEAQAGSEYIEEYLNGVEAIK